MRPIANFGRVLMVWAGTFALMALTAFIMKMSRTVRACCSAPGSWSASF